MVRKTSDIALLLGARGRVPSRSGLGKFLHGILGSWFARSSWRSERPARVAQVPVWLAAVFAIAAFGGGYLVGGKPGLPPGKNDLRIKAPGPNQAGFVGEIDARPLEKKAFIVAAYPGVANADGKAAAKTLAEWLVGQKLEKARPYEYPGADGAFWVVAVYFNGDTELVATRDRLLALGEVPDASFAYYRESQRKKGEEWPLAWAVQ
ncbi:MAG: hypothetical protein WAT39_11680 [Planctomycetota bacterium]